MKKSLRLITAALAAIIFTGGTATLALAEENNEVTPSYPSLSSALGFSNETLTDYAVYTDGTQTAFAFVTGGTNIYYYVSSATTDGYSFIAGELDSYSGLYFYTHTRAITDIEIEYGSVYIQDENGGKYYINEGTARTAAYQFTESADSASVNGVTLTVYDDDHYLYANYKDSAASFKDGTYSNLKNCDGGVYVIKDNTLCKVTADSNDVTSVEINALSFEYADLTQGETILTGGTAAALKEVQTGAYTVTLSAGTYVTNVDLSDVSGTYFTVADGGTTALTKDATYIYLCTVGDIDIVTNGQNAYVTASTGGAKTEITQTDFTTQTATLNTAANLYSSAYMCGATAIYELELGAQVTVNGIVENELLGCSLAYVTYSTRNGDVTGFVAASFLNAVAFSAETDSGNTSVLEDSGYSEDNSIVIVSLSIVIVVLIIAAIIYLTYFSGAGKRRKNKPEKNVNSGGNDGNKESGK